MQQFECIPLACQPVKVWTFRKWVFNIQTSTVIRGLRWALIVSWITYVWA